MAKRLYDWGDGKGKVHTRPKRTGPQLERAKDRKRLADPTYFSQPMTLGDVLREAGRADELRYGGVQGQLGLQQQQIPAWFQDYKNTILTPQQVQQQYQPAIQKQEAVAQETAKPLGLEGQAGEQDQLAAKAREALANLGTSVLTNAQQADTTYFQNRQGVAQAAQLGAQTQNAQQIQDLARERGAFRDQYVTDARDRERAYGLDVRHQRNEDAAFGLDVQKARADVRTDRQKIRADAREKRRERKQEGQEVNKYGYTNEQWARFSPSHRQRIMRAQETEPGGENEPKPLTPAEKRARRKDRETRSQRFDYIAETIKDPPPYPKGHPKAGQRPSKAEVISQLIKQGYSRAEIEKAIRKRLRRPVRFPGAVPAPKNGNSNYAGPR